MRNKERGITGDGGVWQRWYSDDGDGNSDGGADDDDNNGSVDGSDDSGIDDGGSDGGDCGGDNGHVYILISDSLIIDNLHVRLIFDLGEKK